MIIIMLANVTTKVCQTSDLKRSIVMLVCQPVFLLCKDKQLYMPSMININLLPYDVSLIVNPTRRD